MDVLSFPAIKIQWFFEKKIGRPIDLIMCKRIEEKKLAILEKIASLRQEKERQGEIVSKRRDKLKKNRVQSLKTCQAINIRESMHANPTNFYFLSLLLLLHVCLNEAMINQKHTVLPKWDMMGIFIRHESIIFSKWRICTSRRHACFSDATTVWVAWHGVHIYTSITLQHSIKYVCVCVCLIFSSVIVAVAASCEFGFLLPLRP